MQNGEETKYITFASPCYNSQDYMRRCVESLLVGGEDVEIIIVDDGSTDATGEIADYYESVYPNIVRAVHKENGGHGSGVNKGLEMARGIFYKVVDSDDWLDGEAYGRLLNRVKRFWTLREAGLIGEMPDLFVCNYIYDHLDEGTCHTIHYRNVFPTEELCDWNDIGRFHTSQYLIMHALMFRTDVLKAAGVILPEHTFYVDNIFAYKPLPHVRHIYYMDIDLYHYYIGRADQSVNEKVLMSRIDQQIKVTEIVLKCVDLNEVREKYPKLAEYMCRNISIMMAISSIHLLLINSQEAYGKRKRLWDNVKEEDIHLYFRLKYTTLSGLTYLPGRLGGMLTRGGYRAARKIYQFQ